MGYYSWRANWPGFTIEMENHQETMITSMARSATQPANVISAPIMLPSPLSPFADMPTNPPISFPYHMQPSGRTTTMTAK